MNAIFILLLAVEQALGFLWALLLFALCFLGIHILKLAQVGWSQYNPPPPAEEAKKEEKPQEKQAPVQQEPVYYIVEKKRQRAKPTYSEPKRISFK